MSYSSLNDAFNINSDFEKTIRGLNSFNPMNNTMENIKSGSKSTLSESNPLFESNYFGNCNVKAKNCDPNYQNNFYNPNDPLPIIDGIYSGDDNLSWKSLNGTDLYSRGDNITTNSMTNKLTHRDCIKIYNDPDSYSDTILSKALKHVSKCEDCKKGIKNLIITDLKSLNSNEKSNSTKKLIQSNQSAEFKKSSSNNQDNLSQLSAYKNFHNPINSGSLNLSSQSQTNTKIESELKTLSEKINGETNLKYQNALIQNNISKYLEDLEERKKINNKLDKIIDMIKTDFKQDNSNQNNYKLNAELKDTNILNLLTSTQFLSNLSKINELNNLQNQQNQQNTTNQYNQSNTSYESYLLYVGIIVIIVLLIIDIALRFNTKSN